MRGRRLSAVPASRRLAAEEEHKMTIVNVLRDLPSTGADESFDVLWERPGMRLERIVSHGHVTPPGEWYDQDQDEWVVVIRGAARLRVEGRGEQELREGDSVLLPAHCRHRVEWTDPDQPTIWLALHHWPAENG